MHIILGMYFSYACFYWLQKVLWYSGPEQKYRKLYTSISQQIMTAFSTYFLFRGLRSAGKIIITVMDQIRLTLEKILMTSSNGSIFRVTGPLWGGIHRSPMDSPLKGYWRGALMFTLICNWTNGWANNRDAGDLRRHRAHYGATVMIITNAITWVDDVHSQ